VGLPAGSIKVQDLVEGSNAFTFSPPVSTGGDQRIALVMCGALDSTADSYGVGKSIVGRISGKATFVNPYGYVPGNYFGRLPFLLLLAVRKKERGGCWREREGER
jgi:hypothetical protein